MPEVVLRFPEGRYEGEVDDKKVPNGQGCLEFPGKDTVLVQPSDDHTLNFFTSEYIE